MRRNEGSQQDSRRWNEEEEEGEGKGDVKENARAAVSRRDLMQSCKGKRKRKTERKGKERKVKGREGKGEGKQRKQTDSDKVGIEKHNTRERNKTK